MSVFFCWIFMTIFCHSVKISVSTNKVAATSGPYRSMLIRVQECNQTTYPLEKDPPIILHFDVYNTTAKSFLLRGNLTVLRENKQVKFKLKSYIWRNDKWKLTYLLNNIGCHSMVLHMMTTAMGLSYDRETCGFSKGTFVFKDIDMDAINHILASKMEYGRIIWISETIVGSSTYFCYEYETLVEPLEIYQ